MRPKSYRDLPSGILTMNWDEPSTVASNSISTLQQFCMFIDQVSNIVFSRSWTKFRMQTDCKLQCHLTSNCTYRSKFLYGWNVNINLLPGFIYAQLLEIIPKIITNILTVLSTYFSADAKPSNKVTIEIPNRNISLIYLPPKPPGAVSLKQEPTS